MTAKKPSKEENPDAADESIPRIPFDEALKRVWSTPPKPKKKTPKKSEKK